MKWHITALLHVENICFHPHQISNAQAHDISLPCGKIEVSQGNFKELFTVKSRTFLLTFEQGLDQISCNQYIPEVSNDA